jgi:hypothetical protein
MQKEIAECGMIKVKPKKQLIFHIVLHYKSIRKGSHDAVLRLELRVSGPCPSSNILKEHKFMETGSVSILRRKGGDASNQLGPETSDWD